MKHKYRYSANSSQRADISTIKHEMIGPSLPTGIEDRDKLSGFAVESADLTPFCSIAVEARPRQIIVTIATTVFARCDVIRFMVLDSVVLMKVAILTAIAGTLSNANTL